MAVEKDPLCEPGVNLDASYIISNIVRATQYGEEEKCRWLIEHHNIDVNRHDNENCTFLHWAAINNRLEIAKYLLSKGANVNAIGGDLQATPLQWAIRQGHLAMTVLLLTNGSDPSLADTEGCAALHLAAQFAHTPIVGYLLSKGADVNLRDRNGLTPLMWTAFRVTSLDPMRLLCTMGAHVNENDFVSGNTALHFAIKHANFTAIDTLLKNGADISIKNMMGQTAYDMAVASNDVFMISKLQNSAIQHNLIPASFCRKLKASQSFVNCFALLCPFPPVFLVPMVLSCESFSLAAKLLILLIFAIALQRAYKYFRVSSDESFLLLPLGAYFAGKVYLYCVFLLFLWPTLSGNLFVNLVFIVASIGLNYSFIRCWLFDPGTIQSTTEQKLQLIQEMAEGNAEFKTSEFCPTCLVKRPPRSKHCIYCKKCVAGFDHHCPWVGNCIAANNHRFFVQYLIFLITGLLLVVFGCCYYVYRLCGENGFHIQSLVNCSPWISWAFLLAFANLCWVPSMLFCQIYQVLCAEFMSIGGEVLKRRLMNCQLSVRKGCIRNTAEFFCCWKNHEDLSKEWEQVVHPPSQAV